jgi:outer membrane protein assembly factor BamB
MSVEPKNAAPKNTEAKNARAASVAPPAGSAVAIPASSRRRSSAWRYGLLLAWLMFGVALVAYIWIHNAGDGTKQVMYTWYTAPAIVFVSLLWWLFLSGFTWTTRLTGFGLFVVVSASFLSAFRLKEFTGDMVPHFEPRWQRSFEQKAADYWRNEKSEVTSATNGQTASTVVEKLEISPEDWPQFDGPRSEGRAVGVRIRTDWGQRPPRPLWRHPVGAAWSSFAVVGNYAFTQEQRGTDEAVVCYDARDGKQVWAHLDPNQRYDQAMAGIGPRATPTVYDSRVYTFGAAGILNCFAAKSGAVLWSTNALEAAGVKPLQFGMAGSPLVYDKLVVVNPGGPRQSQDGTESSGRAVIAYDRLTGKEVWAGGDYQAAYATPILATLGGVKQVVIFDGLGAAGHDAATGKQLWRTPVWTNEFHNNCAQPIVGKDAGGDGALFLSSGYGTGSIMFDVKKTDDHWGVSERWQAPNKFKLKFNTGVTRDGCVYGLDEGILACFDLAAGKQRWKRGHYGYGQILLFENALFVISEEGDAVLLDVSPSNTQELARFHAIDGKTWNHPAYSNGRLFVRNGEEAACYDLGPLQTASR